MSDLHDLEVHLATCPGCAAELAQYREVRTAVASLRHDLEPVPPGLPDRILSVIEEPERRWVDRAIRVARDRRVHVVAASFGGAILGASAIALIVWRRASRGGIPRAA